MKNHIHRSIVACALFASFAAHAEIIVIVNPAAGPLTQEQLADIYLGRKLDMMPVDLPEDAAIRTEFYRKATGRDAAQVKAIWSRLVFTGKGTPPRQLPDAAAVKKAVAADPKAIGYIDKSALDGTVKAALTIN